MKEFGTVEREVGVRGHFRRDFEDEGGKWELGVNFEGILKS